jgi:uncharacterized protein Yka (UPF0111/DUF47 family)
MTEINNIDLLRIDGKPKLGKGVADISESGEKFENQLLETVKRLETMENEIDAMMQSNTIQIKSVADTRKSIHKDLLGNIDSIVENFSAAGKSSIKTAKNVAAEYETMNHKKSIS